MVNPHHERNEATNARGDRVRKRLPTHYCATCDARMTRVRRNKAPQVTSRTRGHLTPRFGDARSRVWLWQCSGCNADQGPLCLYAWWLRLADADDPRCRIVARLIHRLSGFGLPRTDYDLHAPT